MDTSRPVTIWHNPRCSKSLGALALLRDRGIAASVVDYQKHPPDVHEITHALKLLGLEPRQLLRTDEAVYVELGLANTTLTDDQLIAAMAAHPILIQRPIVFANGKAAVGRPPEAVLAIL